MADPVIHVILTEHPGFGWSVESPQLPELVGGRDSYAELMDDLVSILQFGGAPEEYRMVRHIQRHLTTPEGLEIAIRWRQDKHEEERMAAASGLVHCLEIDAYREELTEAYKTPTGDVLFVASLPSDKLGPLFDQMDQRGDAVSVFLQKPDENAILSTQLLINDHPEVDWKTLDAYGLSRDSTVADLFAAMSEYKRLHDRALVLA
jgi:hypothetical protein